MNKKDKIQLFENTPVRHEWDADKEEWIHQRPLSLRPRA